MTLPAGTRLGPYEVTAQIGVGGMGEIYRATDTNLKRAVAIKVLPASVSNDPERLARFQREAEVLASLNHPHIAQIYGVEAADGTRALVMELVEGEDLSQRIARGPIPLDEALPIARQIAEALEAAHEQGVVHRDLKPANVKVRPDGTVKVLDFGLAKLAGAGGASGAGKASGEPGLSMSPTITSPAMMTGVGVILGTAAYMSPEQAKGRPADKRSDVWAFGCVLYEMLTGRRAFEGEDVSDTLAAVLRGEPTWHALPPDLPSPIRTLIKRCLDRDRRRRIAEISTARFVLEEPTEPLQATSTGAAPVLSSRPRPLWKRAAAFSALALAAALLGGSGVWFAVRSSVSSSRVSRLLFAPSGSTRLSINGNDPDLAITPDGTRIVYIGSAQVFVRALDALEPVVIARGAPRGPFISPDGQWVGFVDSNTTLKRVAITGGPSVTVVRFDGTGSRGATWGPDDAIIFATNNGATGLQRVVATGGTPTVLTRPDRAQGELDHLWPEMLPGGRAVLFTITATGGVDAGQVAVLDLQTGTRKVLLRGASQAHYVPTGHLVYAAAGTLSAVGFDLDRLETRGTPVPVVPEVVTMVSGGIDAVVAGNGTLAYVPGGGGVAGAKRTLIWVDRQGQETSITAPARAFVYPRIAPDGARVAVYVNDQENDTWLSDLARATLTRVTFDPGIDNYPLWTPDGRRLLFASERGGASNLFWQSADGTGEVQRLTESANPQNGTGVSPDGTRLIFTETALKTGDDVMQVELDGMRRVTPLVQTPFLERNGVISPDERWLAYEANDSGQLEIYVRPFPDVNGGRWQVSTGGGARPLWARKGEELFYLSLTGALRRVGIEPGRSWASTPPIMLLKEGYFVVPGGFLGRTYDISPDGRRFLMIKEGTGSDQTAAPPSIVVVQNWTEELKRLVPTK